MDGGSSVPSRDRESSEEPNQRETPPKHHRLWGHGKPEESLPRTVRNGCQNGPEGLLDEAGRVQARCPNLQPADILTIANTISYGLHGSAVSEPEDERVKTTGLNSGEVLATLMDLEMERHLSAIAGSQVPKVLRWMVRQKDKDAPEIRPGASGNEQGRVGEDTYKVARRTQTA